MGIRRLAFPLVSAVCLVAMSSIASAGVVVLDFEGLDDLERVQEFYNGGTGSAASGPGTNYGISFSSNALALIDSDNGGHGNFGGEPSPSTVVFFVTGGAVTMNVDAGFDTGFSFFYSAPTAPGSVTVYDGLGATGNVLAVMNLPISPGGGAPGDPGQYSPFVAFGVTFSGTAKSVDFGGSAGFIGFDDITLGSATPGVAAVPLPGAVWMGLSLLGGLGIVRSRRKRTP